MGIGVAANGDVWIADGSDNQLLFFPGGRIKDGQIVKVAGLKSPFDIVIDRQNRVWVSNSQADTVLRFPANDPTKVDTFHVGIIVRALALDAQGNVWVARTHLAIFRSRPYRMAHPSCNSSKSWPEPSSSTGSQRV